MYTVNRNDSINKHTTGFVGGASMVDLYIRGEGGVVWAHIGYCSQVDDVAVQDLLISDGKQTKTIDCQNPLWLQSHHNK